MKRMVLIPEEKLIRYEKQLDDQPPTNEQAGGSTFSWGFRPPIHYPGGNYPGHDYLYNYPKYPGSMIGRGEDEESMSIEMIVRSIPKSMKKRAEPAITILVGSLFFYSYDGLTPSFYRYVDFTSLYPWCNKNTYNVVGHPEIITENFADVSTYFGLIKCTVLPPRGLFHPVLPYRTEGKLMFPLCKTCADTLNQNPCTHTDEERAILGTWCHVELMKAIEKGYEVLEIHEVWHWEETTDELFKEYVHTFLKLKQEASGYPKHCVTDEQKQQYIDQYYEHEGIRLDPNKIEYNPGLRWLAKLMLNSLWGVYIICKPSLAQSVEHGTVVK